MARPTITSRRAATGVPRRALLWCAALLLVAAAPPQPAIAMPADAVAGASRVCSIVGTAGADRLAGTTADDIVCGRGGADALAGRGGRDWMDGGPGADRVRGDGGPDVLLGGANGDLLQGRTGSDLLRGGPGDDTAFGGAGADDLRGGPGQDGLGGGFGPDALSGGPGRDIAYYGQRGLPVRVSIGAGANDGVAGEGDDVHSDVEDIRGGRGNDVLTGNGGSNQLFGGGGRDRLRGRGGNDVLMGGDGRDRIDARDGAGSVDRIECGAGEDTALVDPGDAVDPDCEHVVGGPSPSPPQNRAPTGVELSNASVAENEPAGTTVGVLSAGDPDPGDTHAFALVPGAGDADNGSFQIVGSTLRTAAVFDFETKDSYTVRIRATDFGAPAGQIVRAFTITVTDVNEATAITTTAAALAYTENDPATVVDGGLTLTDPGETDLEGATVRISAGFESADELLFTDQLGITHAYDTGTGVLTLTGTSSLANYQTALRSVEYRHTGDDPATVKTVEFRADDGGGLGPASTRNINVTPVNDAPTVDTSAGTASFTEGAGPVTVDPGVTVGDPDSALLSGATVELTSGFAAAEDSLGFTNQLGITGAYDPGTGVLTLSGMTTAANYQAALRSVTYDNSSSNPSTATRTVSFQVTDAGGLASNVDTRDVTVAAANNAPTITTTAAALLYTEGDPATAVDGSLTVADVDDADLEGATVEVSAGFESGDELLFTNQLGITGAYNAGTGVLTLTGTSSLANYQTALRSVQYRHSGDNPATSKTIEFTVDDGTISSSPATRALAITRVNDAPTLDTTNAALAYPENAGPLAADAGITVTDPDSAQIQGATVQITSNFVAAQDELAFADQLGITGSYDDTSGTLTLSGTASVADYQAALRAVTYENSSDNPSPPARTLTFQATDADGAASAPATRDISLGAANDAATITTTGGALAYTEGDPATAVDGGLTVTDLDDASLEGATVRISAGFESGDELLFTNQSGITGAYNAGTGVLTLTGTSSLANYQTALRSVQYRHTGDNPAIVKTVEFRADDGDGLGPASTRNIDVTRVNDGPQITTTGADLAYTENAGPVAIDGGLTVSDPDSTQLSGATVTISSNFQSAQDDLGFADQLGITGSYNDATGVLTLSGSASMTDYQTALRSVTYVNVSEGPAPLTRTISFQATDDLAAASNIATRGIAITAVNDPPSAVDDTGTTDEDTTLNVAAPGVLANDTDIDPGDTKIVDRLNGSPTLTGTSAKGATVTINADGSYTYNPGSVLQGLSTGQQDTDSFTYRMSDSGGASSTATVNLTITGISDAPTAVADTFNAIGNTGLFVGTTRPAGEAGKEITGSVLANDTDPDTPQASLVAEPVTNAPTTLGGTITIESDGNFTYHPDDADTGTDTFTYRVCDASPCNASTVANSTGTLNLVVTGEVWYVRNNAVAGGDGTSDGPYDTLAEAEAASGANDTVFVHDGDNTPTGLGGDGYVMNPAERLIGEHEGLQVDPDGGGGLGTETLHLANAGAHPTLTATNADVISLDDGNELRGLAIDPDGTGGGIAGGAGDTDGGTIDDVNVLDGGPAGTQAGLELNGTTGTFNVTNLAVDNKATGVLLNTAGTTDFGSTTIISDGGPGLSATATNMSTSQFDSITSSNSANGGVNLDGTTGTTLLGDGTGLDLSLTTTSGAQPAFRLNNAGTVTVASAGTDNLSATGGPAVDVVGTAGITLDFDDVDSTNSSGDGINLAGLGTGTFTATSGTIVGAAGIAFDLDSGSGTVTYPGALDNGSGATAEISGRTGGAVTLSGAISDGPDAGGGISLLSNSGGSTAFSNSLKVLNTTTSNAVSFTNSDGHTLDLSNGGLDIDTTSGQGVVATSSGTIVVRGSGNTVSSGSGRAVNVQSTDFGGLGFTLQSVSSNGAPNGILLNNTGTSAGMTITGTGGANSGGSIQNATEHGISLTTTQSFTADELSITGANFAGVDGTDVTNFTFTDGEILNAGDSLTNPLHGSIAFNDQSANENNIDGTLVVTGNLLKDHYGGGVDVFNRSGTISDATVSNNTIDSPADENLSKEDAISFNLFGSASTVANLTKAQIEDNVITDHPSGNGITILGAQTNTGGAPTPTVGVPGSSTNRILIDGNLLTGDPTLRFGGSGIQAGIEGRGVGNFDITNNGTVANPITNVGTHGIATGNGGNSEAEYLIQNNHVTANNFEAGAIGIRSASDKHIMADLSTLATPILKTIIDNNVVRNTTGSGIRVLASNSNGTAEVRVTNNNVADGGAGTPAIRVENGSSADAAFDPTMCATISNNTTAANAPTAGGHTFPGIALFKRSTVAANYQFGIVGLAPSPSTIAQTESFVTGQNPNSNLGANFYAGKRVTVDAGDNFVSCTHPAGF